MKISPLIVLISFSLNAFAQTDTTIYFSKLNKRVDSENDAVIYKTIVSKQKGNYVMNSFGRSEKKWVKENITRLTRENDSTITYTTTNIEGKRTITFHKTDSGYLIREYSGKIFIEEGLSMLIFPYVRNGYWKNYDRINGSLSLETWYKDNQAITNKCWINSKEFIKDVFFAVDKYPEYEGGDSELLKYISDNLVYPENARRSGIEGRVLVSFVLMADGSIKWIHMLNKNASELEDEAVRVIKHIPNRWNTAEIGGEKVNIMIMLPVNFSLATKPTRAY